MAKSFSRLQGITGCLTGLAIGDAIGKQTETLTPSEIAQWYPNGVAGFHGELGSIIPRYQGKRYEWRVGETTDDTEQTIAVAQALLNQHPITHEVVGKELLTCKKSNRLTLSLGRFQQKGDANAVANDGQGCGAAMRIAPVGIVYSHHNLSELVEATIQTSIPTHGHSIAISAASAVAAAISAALENYDAEAIIATACEAARDTARLIPTEKTFDYYIKQIYDELKEVPNDVLLEYLLAKPLLPNHTTEIVPLAIALAVLTNSAQTTTLLAANLGGDTDSIATIGSAVAGASNPSSVNPAWLEAVEQVNHHQLNLLAQQLATFENTRASKT